jgi:hypothetical protein
MKGKDSLFNLSISLGDASMLAKMFGPRFHQVRFYEAAWIGRITI